MVPYALAAAVGALIGAAVGFFLARRAERTRQEKERAAAKDEASRILTQASSEAESLKKAATLGGREEVLHLRETWETEETRRREETERVERRLEERSTSLDRKFDLLNDRDGSQERRSQEFEVRENLL